MLDFETVMVVKREMRERDELFQSVCIQKRNVQSERTRRKIDAYSIVPVHLVCACRHAWELRIAMALSCFRRRFGRAAAPRLEGRSAVSSAASKCGRSRSEKAETIEAVIDER